MSAGTPHKRHNLKHPAELKKIMAEGDTSALAKRWQDIDADHDVPDLLGYNVGGTTVFIDRDFIKALLDPAYATHLGIGPIDTGMSPEDTLDCLLTHEHTEKQILDGDNAIDDYEPAHEFATCAEHEEVRKRGGSPLKYERALAPAIKFCEAKHPTQVAKDFDCTPMLDQPDADDLRVLEILRGLGVQDAFKEAKDTADYRKATDGNHCIVCKGWELDRNLDLSTCRKIEGLVRDDRTCARFKLALGMQPRPVAPAPEPEQEAPEPEPQEQPQPEAPAPEPEAPPEPPPTPEPATPPSPSPDVQALADSVAKMAEAVNALAAKPKRKKRTITTRRDEHGNMVADVSDADEEQ